MKGKSKQPESLPTASADTMTLPRMFLTLTALGAVVLAGNGEKIRKTGIPVSIVQIVADE